MNDFENRQISLMRQLINEYRINSISLNVFVQKIESLSSILKRDDFSNRVDPIVLNLEVINSVLLDEGRGPTYYESEDLNVEISKLEQILNECAPW